MSKKDKSKFRKQLKAQKLQEINQEVKTSTTMASSEAISQPVQKTSGINQTATTSAQLLDLDQIRYDLKKTGFVVLLLAIIIAILYYLDSKYGILLNFGDWLFKVLNIQ